MPPARAAVSEEMPRSDQGDTAESLRPAPKVNSTMLSATAANPPARMAGQDTAEVKPSPASVAAGVTMTVSTMSDLPVSEFTLASFNARHFKQLRVRNDAQTFSRYSQAKPLAWARLRETLMPHHGRRNVVLGLAAAGLAAAPLRRRAAFAQ